MLWLGFLRLFNAVQILNIRGSTLWCFLVTHIARVLGELTREGAAGVLSMVHTLLLNGFDRVGHLVTPLLKPFIDIHKLLGQPVAVRWSDSKAATCYIYGLCLPLWTYLLTDKWVTV